MALAPTPAWTDRLAFDVALMLEGSGERLEDVLDRYSLTAAKWEKFNKDPQFLRRVVDYRAEIAEKGLTFKLKAKAQAEELLMTSWNLIHNAEVSPAVKADLIKSTVKWAGLDSPHGLSADELGGGVKITINLGGTPLAPTEPLEKAAKSLRNGPIKPIPVTIDANYTPTTTTKAEKTVLPSLQEMETDADELLSKLDALIPAATAV